MANPNVVVSDVDETMRKVVGGSTMKGPTPGASRFKGIVFEGLGTIDEFPTERAEDNEQGTGESCVVLSDVLTVGAGDGAMSYVQGHVRRLSKLVSGYADPEIPRDVVKANIRRLFELGAIRLATREEATQDRIEVNLAHETETLQDERAKRVAAEMENAELRAQLEKLQGTPKKGADKDPTFDD
jgi:hypothetical protein